MQDGDDLQRLSFWPINDEIRVDEKKSHIGRSQVAPPSVRHLEIRQVNKLAADNGLYAIGGSSLLSFFRNYRCQTGRGLPVEPGCSAASPLLCFQPFKVRVKLIFWNPLPALEFRDAPANARIKSADDSQ